MSNALLKNLGPAATEVWSRGGKPLAAIVVVGAVLFLTIAFVPGLNEIFPLWMLFCALTAAVAVLSLALHGQRRFRLTLIGAALGAIVACVLTLIVSFLALVMATQLAQALATSGGNPGAQGPKLDMGEAYQITGPFVWAAVLFFGSLGAWGGSLALWVWDEPEKSPPVR